MKKRKNPAAVALGRKGGKATSEAKTAAAKRNALTRWQKVKAAYALAVAEKEAAWVNSKTP